MNKQLDYPVDSFISYCDEYYKVCSNNDDYKGIVMDMNGDKSKFYFECYGEKSVIIKDKDLIKELEELLSSKLISNNTINI